jgi:hypothetical protein
VLTSWEIGEGVSLCVYLSVLFSPLSRRSDVDMEIVTGRKAGAGREEGSSETKNCQWSSLAANRVASGVRPVCACL